MSGPLLDRVDIRVELPAVDPVALGGVDTGEPTAVIAERVAAARDRAASRWRGTPWRRNGDVPGPQVRRMWHPDPASAGLLERALRAGLLTGRGYDRVLRLALTSADLAGAGPARPAGCGSRAGVAGCCPGVTGRRAVARVGGRVGIGGVRCRTGWCTAV